MGRRVAHGAVVAAFAAVVVALSACTASTPAPGGSGTATPASPVETSTPVPTATFAPKGDAAANKAFFDQVNKETLARHPKADGLTIVKGLVAAGFPAERMELTKGKTSIGLDASSVQFAVRLGKGCLLGQLGSGGAYHSEAVPALGTGRCLIGSTKPLS